MGNIFILSGNVFDGYWAQLMPKKLIEIVNLELACEQTFTR